jgi:hypothetical protein
MSVLDKIRELSAKPVSAATVLPVSEDDLEIKLRRKAGVLAAFGLADKTIADTLFVSLEQVAAIKETHEFKQSCAKQTEERTQRLIDLEQGWDGIEEASTAQVLHHLMHSRDPEFALRAAMVANRAQRRSPATLGRVIDASNVGNVITLTVNRNYVQNITNQENGGKKATVEIQGEVKEIPRKASDISSPKRLADLLGIHEEGKAQKEIASLAESLGVSLDELEEIAPRG